MKKLIGTLMLAFAAIGFSSSADAQTVVRERTVVRHHSEMQSPVQVEVRTHTAPRGHAYGYYRNREFHGYRKHYNNQTIYRNERMYHRAPVTTTRRTVIYR